MSYVVVCQKQEAVVPSLFLFLSWSESDVVLIDHLGNKYSTSTPVRSPCTECVGVEGLLLLRVVVPKDPATDDHAVLDGVVARVVVVVIIGILPLEKPTQSWRSRLRSPPIRREQLSRATLESSLCYNGRPRRGMPSSCSLY